MFILFMFISMIVILVLELSIFGYKFSVINEAQKVNGCAMTTESRRELYDFLFKKNKRNKYYIKRSNTIKKIDKKNKK